MIDRSLIVNNFWWKLTSVALATIVWVTFHNEMRSPGQSSGGVGDLLSRRVMVRNKDLPIAIQRSPRDTRPFRLEPSSVDITVSGDPSRIGRAAQEELSVFVDLSRAGDEPHRARIQVSLPPGVKLEKVSPDEVHVELAKPGALR